MRSEVCVAIKTGCLLKALAAPTRESGIRDWELGNWRPGRIDSGFPRVSRRAQTFRLGDNTNLRTHQHRLRVRQTHNSHSPRRTHRIGDELDYFEVSSGGQSERSGRDNNVIARYPISGRSKFRTLPLFARSSETFSFLHYCPQTMCG